jgi:hypothetical protein
MTKQPILESTLTRVRALPIALWCTKYVEDVDWCQRVHEQAQPQPRKMEFAPVHGAYVACIATSGSRTGPWRIRYGRTNDFGWVIQRELASIGDEGEPLRSGWVCVEQPVGGVVPRAAAGDSEDAGVFKPSNLEMFRDDDAVMAALDSSDANAGALYMVPNATYQIFWSYDRRLFDFFVRRYDIDPVVALEEFEVREYVARPFEPLPETNFPAHLSSYEQGWVERLRSSGIEGYHAGWPNNDAMSAAIFDVTPRTLRTLYLCEWFHEECVQLVQQSKDWSYLLTLRGIIEATRAGAVIPDLARSAPSGPSAKAGLNMRLYLHALAGAGLDGRGVAASVVDVAAHSRSSKWRFVAESLHANPRYAHLTHPATLPDYGGCEFRDYYFTEEEQAALVAYFELYVLGFRYERDAEALDAQWNHIQEAVGWVLANAAKRLKTITHVQVLSAASMHVPKVDNSQLLIVDRYHRLCAVLGIQFWEPAALALTAPQQWDRKKLFFAWFAEDVGLLNELFRGFLTRYVAAYRGLGVAEIESMVEYFHKYHLATIGAPLERKLQWKNATLRLEPTTRGDTVLAIVKHPAASSGAGKAQAPHVVAQMELLTDVQTLPRDQAFAAIGKSTPRYKVRRLQRAGTIATRTFAVRQQTLTMPDMDGLAAFPKQLAVLGGALKTACAITSLLAAKSADPTNVDTGLYLNLTQEIFALAGPSTELVAAALAASGGTQAATVSTWLLRGGAGLAGAGLLAESVRNFISGATTVMSLLPDQMREALGVAAKTDRDRYMDEGHTVAALAETAKGVLQVGLGVSGPFVLGGATTVAGVALSQVVAVGLVLVAMAEVVIYLDTGGPSATADFKRGVASAQVEQFSLRGPDEPVPDVSRMRCRVARRLGALNVLAQV